MGAESVTEVGGGSGLLTIIKQVIDTVQQAVQPPTALASDSSASGAGLSQLSQQISNVLDKIVNQAAQAVMNSLAIPTEPTPSAANSVVAPDAASAVNPGSSSLPGSPGVAPIAGSDASVSNAVPVLGQPPAPGDSPAAVPPVNSTPAVPSTTNATRAPSLPSTPSTPPTEAAAPVPADAPASKITTTTTQAAPAVSTQEPLKPSAAGAVDGGGSNSILVRNTTDKPMDVAMFRNLAPGMHPNFEGPNAQFKLDAHSEMKISVPDDWQGRLQKYSGNTQDPSNWAELNFEQKTGKIWFNESDIPGRNSSLEIKAPDGTTAGIKKSVIGKAPSDIVTTDSSGDDVIKSPQWFDGKTNPKSVAYLNQEIGKNNAYVLPPDDQAVRVAQAKSLTINIGVG